MTRKLLIIAATVLLVRGPVCFGSTLKSDSSESPDRPVLQAVRVDVHERLYPDRWPEHTEVETVSVPRGAPATFQFAVRAKSKGTARLSITCDAPGKVRLHWLQSVHVEGNTQGSLKNYPGGEVPEGWMEHLVRKAPFDTLEVLVEDNTMPIVPDNTHGVVLEFMVPRDAKPATYDGTLLIFLDNEEAAAPFSFRVHRTALPDPLPLHSVHWLWPEPHNLTNGAVPEWWNEQHWQLLEVAGRQLRRFGDDTVYTPLVNYRQPLIQITRHKNNTFTFDYSRFDRWGEMFLGLGFRYLSGHHILNLVHSHMGGTFVIDEATGKKQPLLKDTKDQEAWLAFLPTFYGSFHAHLKKKGWVDNYIQCQYDEPKDVELYKRLAALVRKHMPGVRTTDAINSNRQDTYSPLVDEQVFNLIGLNQYQQVAAERVAAGKGVWLYHCTSPYPPHPNRHIDSYLTESRLYPWLCYKLGANGFLFWGANIYRGADEYKTSIGPFPNGSQNPGHPPGDNWLYYRSTQGLRPSIRIVSFREGLIDHALLTMLEKRNPKLAKDMVTTIVPNITTFERNPVAYHQTRTAILEALDNL